jgi:hypothetical protein
MAQDWPTTAPTVDPTIHHYVATQAYQAGGGDYFRSGYYSHGGFSSAALSTLVLAANQHFVRPFLVPVRRSFDRIGVNVTAAASSGGVLRLGLYTNDQGLAASLVVDAGAVASDTTGAKEAVVSLTLDPGLYWVSCVAQTTGCTVTAYPSSMVTPMNAVSTAPPTTANVNGGRSITGNVSGALPASVAAAAQAGNSAPVVCLRAL